MDSIMVIIRMVIIIMVKMRTWVRKGRPLFLTLTKLKLLLAFKTSIMLADFGEPHRSWAHVGVFKLMFF